MTETYTVHTGFVVGPSEGGVPLALLELYTPASVKLSSRVSDDTFEVGSAPTSSAVNVMLAPAWARRLQLRWIIIECWCQDLQGEYDAIRRYLQQIRQ